MSDPLPVDGTGEGCVVELSDGRILYSSRQHHVADDAVRRARAALRARWVLGNLAGTAVGPDSDIDSRG